QPQPAGQAARRHRQAIFPVPVVARLAFQGARVGCRIGPIGRIRLIRLIRLIPEKAQRRRSTLRPAKAQRKMVKLISTMVAPVGRFMTKESEMPETTLQTPMPAAQTMAVRNPL